jgi:lipopolysaccharide assembly outer membrane protein LptD (OstA)
MKLSHVITKLIVSAGLLSLAGVAQASCDSASYWSSNPAEAAALCGSKTQATATVTQQVATTQQISAITGIVSSLLAPSGGAPVKRQSAMNHGSGVASGSPASKLTVWGAASGADVSTSYVNQLWDGRVNSAIGGVSYAVSDKLLAGVSLAYTDSRVNMVFTKGSNNTTSYSVAPYVGYKINDMFSIDAVLGFGASEADTSSASGTITAKPKSDQTFLSANLTGTQWYGDLQVTGKAGLVHAIDRQKSYSNNLGASVAGSTSTTQQLVLGGQVGYWMNGFMPFAGLKYTNDIRHVDVVMPAGTTPLPANDKDSFTVELGANMFSKGSISGGVSYSSELGRKEMKNNSLLGNINYRF